MIVYPIGPALVATTSRLLSPLTVTRSSLTLASGVEGVFGGVTYDPVRRWVTFYPYAPSIREGLEYVFDVHPGMRTWDGVTDTHGARLRFIAGRPIAAPERLPPSLAHDVAPLLAAHCGQANCHGGVTPTMALDLSSPAGILNTTVNVLARERPAALGDTVDIIEPRWGSMFRVDPGVVAGQGEPAYSYLIYKMLGDGPVLGETMPLDATPLTTEQIALVSDWIAAGALDN